MQKNLLTKIQTLKSQLDDLRPFQIDQLKNLKQWFRIGFIHHNNAIEGNTLTLTEVKIVIEDGITIGGKTITEIQETINHNQIMELINDSFIEIQNRCSESFIKKLHLILFQNILTKKELGVYRTIQVYISGSNDILPKPSELDVLMKNFVHTYSNVTTLKDVAKMHYDFVKIHPFIDGNGRIARLLMNLGLIHLGYFPIIIPKIRRSDYISSLQGNNFVYWYDFFLEQVYENHKDYLRFLVNN